MATTRHRCGDLCRLVMAARRPVNVSRLADRIGVSRFTIARTARAHAITTRSKGKRHQCARACRLVWAALRSRMPVTTALPYFWPLHRLREHHPDWPWFDGRRRRA